jgi:hypothetical protein
MLLFTKYPRAASAAAPLILKIGSLLSTLFFFFLLFQFYRELIFTSFVLVRSNCIDMLKSSTKVSPWVAGYQKIVAISYIDWFKYWWMDNK